jgi:CheY-like chemotaxis protein
MNENLLCDYELILIDCEMPFMDGYEATQLIISFLKNLALPIPHIIAVSGNTGRSHTQKCLKYGMETVLHKPVEP